uniref:Protein kinase domain-containing protein n=1 Tax=Oryza brachyantha TaxID=4533 RepID=J3N3N5_ORYBR
MRGRCEGRRWRWVLVWWVLAAAAAAVVVVEGFGVPESELETFRDERGGLVALRDALRFAGAQAKEIQAREVEHRGDRPHRRACAVRGGAHLRPPQQEEPGVSGDIKDKAEQAGNKVSGSGSRSTESGKGAAELQFFRPEKASFGLDELFQSTAEMLGKGRLGITYRVTLNAGPAVVVVKRLRNMGHVPRKDFAHTMQLLGKLRHENVVEVVACYFSKEEKLVVFEHVPGCSLFQLLHENRGEGRTPLSWPARLAIAKGMARGLAYLHQALPLFHRPPHGNLKSSNVLVAFPSPPGGGRRQKHGGDSDAAPVPKLTDHGFHPLLPHHGHRLAAAKCPEFARGTRRPSSRADVFCLGLVLLEVVTGKVPVDDDGDLAEWARLALSHEWSTDILDVEIVADRDRHGDMLRLTEVALLCAAVEPERRPKIHAVVRMIDEIAAGGGGAGACAAVSSTICREKCIQF